MKTAITQVACIGVSKTSYNHIIGQQNNNIQCKQFDDVVSFCHAVNSRNFDAIITEGNEADPIGLHAKDVLDKLGFGTLPFTVIVNKFNPSMVKMAIGKGIAEIFLLPLPSNIISKIELLVASRNQAGNANDSIYKYKVPFAKRLFDIVMSSMALLFLSPVFLLTALWIRLESKGPVLYYSLRVGTGYRIFKFYKFRSMFVNADAKLAQLKHLNQYAKPTEGVVTPANHKCEACLLSGLSCATPLYADNQVWCEKTYAQVQLAEASNTFVKIKDDPRVTRVGKFIRNTSIDELPQLWNVLIGDMSLVGNRPLPLYEAEKLTTDSYALRFMAPAGITGLWQVSKRGKGEMSEEERISLDNDYAKSFGLWFDIKLIMRTIPALFQKENV